MIGIVDYGMGNLLSVFNAFEYLGVSVRICSNPEDLSRVDRIVLPGVGAIGQCISKLNENAYCNCIKLVQWSARFVKCLKISLSGSLI